jgi:hypothetical protein
MHLFEEVVVLVIEQPVILPGWLHTHKTSIPSDNFRMCLDPVSSVLATLCFLPFFHLASAPGRIEV